MTSKFLLMALATCATFCAWSQTNANETALSTTASLRDGSKIKGQLLTRSFKGEALFDKALELSADYVKSINMSGTNGAAKVSLTNGDTLSLTLTTPSVEIASTLGRLSIAHAKLNSLTIAKASPSAGDGSGLVFHCTFDDESSVTSPTVGPNGRLLNGRFVPGKNGNGLYVQRGLSACEFYFPANKFTSKGCIEFYAKFMDGKTEFSTGGDPRFMSFYNGMSKKEFGTYEYASNNGFGDCGLSAVFGDVVTTHSGFKSMMAYSEIFNGKPYEDWHHYAMVWNENGIDKFSTLDSAPRLAILIDGQNVGTRYRNSGNTFFASLHGRAITLGIPMCEIGPSYNNKSSFIMDDLKIWSFDKTEF